MDIHKFINSSKLGIFVFDPKTGATRWSNYHKEIFGIPSDAEAPSLEEIKLYYKNPGDWERIQASIQKMIVDGTPYDDTVQITLKDGSKKWIWAGGEVVINSKNEMEIWGTTRDITEQKEQEKQLIRALKKAEESDMLKTAFLQNISHEVRTPLNAISGFAQILESDFEKISPQSIKNYLGIIHKNSQQLASIISDILTIASLENNKETLKLNEFNLNELMLKLYANYTNQTLNTSVSVFAQLPLNNKNSIIISDSEKLSEILSNLIGNAVKFTVKGNIEFGYQVKDDLLEFFVKDTGIGIHPEELDQIFNKFEQSHEFINTKYSGTGIGLAITKAFVEMLDGKIWVESALGIGSTFFFTVPYNPKIQSNEIQPEDYPNKTILIVEDVDSNQLLISQLLKERNVTLVYASNGQQAIDIFNANPLIDLILMDIKMPGLTGDKAAKIIRTKRPGVTIIAQTAYALKDDIQKFGHLFDDYLAKPFEIDEFDQIISKYLY